MREAMNELIEAVRRTEGRTESLIELINGIADQLEHNAGNPDEVRAAAAALRANVDKIDVAIDANDGIDQSTNI